MLMVNQLVGFGVANGGVWTPANIATAAWWDFTDISSLYQSTDTSSPVTASGQEINRVTDKSGNSRHISSTVGPDYTESGGKSFATFTVSERLEGPDLSSLTDVAVWLLFKPSVTTHTSFYNAAALGNTMFISEASSAFPVNDGVGTVTTFVDDVQLSAETRGALAAAVGTTLSIVEVRGVTLANFTTPKVGSGYGVGYDFSGEIHELLIVPSAVSSANRADIYNYLSAKAA